MWGGHPLPELRGRMPPFISVALLSYFKMYLCSLSYFNYPNYYNQWKILYNQIKTLELTFQIQGRINSKVWESPLSQIEISFEITYSFELSLWGSKYENEKIWTHDFYIVIESLNCVIHVNNSTWTLWMECSWEDEYLWILSSWLLSS